MDELTRLRTQAGTVGEESTKLQESIPGLLQGLKSNLTSIFTRDNPMMQERENALTTFLTIPSQTRAELLPQNQPIFAGSPLNVSPSQQEAIVTARRNAALVPLAGLNQSIVGQYGNIGDILSNAANLYQSQVLGGQNRANIAQKAFENALAQEKEAREGRTAGGGYNEILAWMKQQEAATQAELDRIAAEIEAKYRGQTVEPTNNLPSDPFAAVPPSNWQQAFAQNIPIIGGLFGGQRQTPVLPENLTPRRSLDLSYGSGEGSARLR